MASGLGIAGLILGIFGLVIPLLGWFLSIIALGCVTVAALFGNRGFAIATVVISAVAFMMTPTLWIDAANANGNGNPFANESSGSLVTISVVMLAAPIIAMIVGKKPNSR